MRFSIYWNHYIAWHFIMTQNHADEVFFLLFVASIFFIHSVQTAWFPLIFQQYMSAILLRNYRLSTMHTVHVMRIFLYSNSKNLLPYDWDEVKVTKEWMFQCLAHTNYDTCQFETVTHCRPSMRTCMLIAHLSSDKFAKNPKIDQLNGTIMIFKPMIMCMIKKNLWNSLTERHSCFLFKVLELAYIVHGNVCHCLITSFYDLEPYEIVFPINHI